MSASVPRELLELLDRLGLADTGTIRAVEGRVRRLGRELPRFQSIWVDALLQARLLTPYQATEINAGRGTDLRLGPYVLMTKLSSLGYAQRWASRHAASGNRAELIVMEEPADGRDGYGTESLATLTARAPQLTTAGLAPLVECGCEGGRIWAVMRTEAGQTAAEHVVRHGRMPPPVVMEIARQMVAALVHLEQAGLTHGDVSLKTLMLTEKGRALLFAPGLRAIARPAEGFAHTDLAPEYYDSLAPERIDGGAPADNVTDLYGCGCLWWHLLAGRACFAGGDSLGKLRAHLTDEPIDVRTAAPDAPEDLAKVIGACVARDRKNRPQSASELARRLGPPTPAGRAEVGRWVKPTGGSPPIHVPSSRGPLATRAAWPAAAIGMALVGFVAVLWAIGLPSRSVNGRRKVPSQELPATVSEFTEQESPAVEPEDRQLATSLDQRPAGENRLILSADGPVTLDTSELSDGMCVSGPPGVRVTVFVRGSPLVLSRENVLFDGIDFVWQPGPILRSGDQSPVMLQVESGRIRFRHCTFQTEAGQPGNCSAIGWVFPVNRSGLALPSGRLSLSDCVFYRVNAGVDARTAAALTIECDNLLHLGPGPLVRLDHAPRVDEPLGLALKNVTLRQAGSVLEIRDQGAVDKSGTISVSARLCVFEPRASGALLSFVGPAAPATLAKAIYWTGEGALVTPEARIAQWTDASGKTAELNDEAFSIGGLVRSPVEFAGVAEPVVGSNVARRWQAPLPTADAPGIQPASLPQPVRQGFAAAQDDAAIK
jgi:hypothetical protein